MFDDEYGDECFNQPAPPKKQPGKSGTIHAPTSEDKKTAEEWAAKIIKGLESE